MYSYKEKFKNILVTLICLLSMQVAGQNTFQDPLYYFNDFPEGAKYQDTTLSASDRVKDVIKHLTYDEGLIMTGGWNKFFVPAVARLGLRPVFMANASQGVNLREAFTNEKTSTSFPGALALAATWNKDLAYEMGESIGKECRICGVDFLLGPGLNMQRFSVSGRNYEYYGEDPFLTSRMAVNFIKGLQSQDVLATAKHFIGNDQEFCRHITSSNIDERTLREIYLPPWEAAIREGKVKAIMTGNNLINGTPNAMDKVLLNDVIREEYGFTGVTMTDWQNTNYFPALQHLFPTSGMSLLMPDNQKFLKYLQEYLHEHPEDKDKIRKQLEKKVFHNLLPLFEMGIYDRPVKDKSLVPNMAFHKENARQIAEEAICLLKNEEHLLPLSTGKKVIMIGDIEMHCGKGSGFVQGYDHTSFAQGLKKVYKDNFEFLPETSEFQIKQADLVIYSLNKESGEGLDVPFEVGYEHKIEWAAALNPNVVVLINSCNNLPMPWMEDVKAVLWCYTLGQERGNALAGIISGKVNPSGKLPFTIEKDFSDSQDPEFNYLGGKPYWYGNNYFYKDYWLGLEQEGANEHFRSTVMPHQIIPVDYKERIFIGYRWYDQQNIEVHFPFGHGLSYTQFEYSEITLSKKSMNNSDSLKVNLKVKNIGKREGAEVVQLYLRDIESNVERPVKELKHFIKVTLKPGEMKDVSFTIKPNDLCFWDTITHDWKTEPGIFEVLLGSSSRDIRLIQSFIFK